MTERQYRELLSIGRRLVEELDSEAVLGTVLEVARDVTGARYAALGVLDEDRGQLDRFLVSGVEAGVERAIGERPRGRGVLGELIRDPRPLRLTSVGGHPRSYGFPPGHPPMETFLGVPVMIRGEAFGNLYLTEKDSGEFTADDEEALVILAEWAGVAIENARLHERLSRRHDELQHAVLALETSTAITRALAGETQLDRVLELIAKRGRAVMEAETLAILLVDGDEMVTVASAGTLASQVADVRVALDDSPIADAVRTGHLHSLTSRDLEEYAPAGKDPDEPRSGLSAPLIFRGRRIGALVAFDHLANGDFSDKDAEVLRAFADSAAMAVGSAQSVLDENRRRRLEATEAERRRWARELHDDTLQELAALRLGLGAARRAEDPEAMREVIEWAMSELENRIAALRGLIADVRPASLDELGLQPALESLAERVRSRGLDVRLDVDLDYEQGRKPTRHLPVVEDTAYRLAQEGLTNVLKHAEASTASLEVSDADGDLELLVRDDGRGFAPDSESLGFGVVGMRERAELLGGRLEIHSELGRGTELRAVLPARQRVERSPRQGRRAGRPSPTVA